MKQKLIALLKTSFASKGFNAKELESLADLLISQKSLTEETTDDELTTAVTDAKPMADFIQSVASRQVSDVKKTSKVEEPVNPPANPAIPENETTTEKMLREALEGIKTLTAEVTNLKGDKVATTRREQFIKSMEGTSKEYQERELKKFDRFSFKDDEDFNAFIEELKPDHAAAIQAEADSKGGNWSPGGGVGGPGSSTKEASEAEIEEVFENIKI